MPGPAWAVLLGARRLRPARRGTAAREDYKWYKLTEAARIAEYEWTGEAHGSLADALACLAVQKYVDAEWRRLRGPEGIQMLYPNFRF